MIGRVTQYALEAASRADWQAVGELMNINQGLMDALGVNNEQLAKLVFALREDPGIMGSKISGSGLGDCVVGLGKAARQDWDVPAFSIRAEAAGVQMERVES